MTTRRTTTPRRTPTDSLLITRAAEFGRAHFARGGMCASATDAEFTRWMCETAPSFSAEDHTVRMDVMDAWQRAWTDANLAQPVSAVPNLYAIMERLAGESDFQTSDGLNATLLAEAACQETEGYQGDNIPEVYFEIAGHLAAAAEADITGKPQAAAKARQQARTVQAQFQKEQEAIHAR